MIFIIIEENNIVTIDSYYLGSLPEARIGLLYK